MPIHFKFLSKEEHSSWDSYVFNHPDANLYHLSGWKTVIEKTYGQNTYYLIAATTQPSDLSTRDSIVGILPLVHMRHFLFGNQLVSLPYFDMGGLLANDEIIERALLEETVRLGQNLKTDTVELRHVKPLLRDGKQDGSRIQEGKEPSGTNQTNSTNSANKALMLLDLPDSKEELMKSFKSKLRSQIKRPMKEGCAAKIGGLELLDDFYSVFCVNMRDLGSPVHSKNMLRSVVAVFNATTKIIIVYKEKTPVACSLVVGFNDVLENPWASSLREYSRFSPNMLLYWTMLSYACEHGYHRFDFGRSTPGEGTYRFKRQWGAKPFPLHWYTVSKSGQTETGAGQSEKAKYKKVIEYWRKLPVPLTCILGPMIRKHISL